MTPESGRPRPSVVDAHVAVSRVDLMAPEARAFAQADPAWPDLERLASSPEALLEHMDREGIEQAWLATYCAKDVIGFGWEVNEWVAEYAAADPRRLVAVGGYDPRHDGKGEEAVERLHELGIRALKIHPVHQHLRPNGPRLRPALAACERRGIPVLVHTGQSPFPGSANRFGDPSLAERVCTTFPRLKVVFAHAGHPDHTREAVEAVLRHPNAWLDVAGIPTGELKQRLGDLEALSPRILWGSGYPAPGGQPVAENLRRFQELGLSEAAQRRVLHDNAQQVLAA
jgi:uncharacterized protein